MQKHMQFVALGQLPPRKVATRTIAPPSPPRLVSPWMVDPRTIAPTIQFIPKIIAHTSKFPKKSYEWTEENNALSASTTIILPKVIFQDCNLGVKVNSFHIFFKDFSYILHNTFYNRTPLSK